MNRDMETGRMIGTPLGEKFPAIVKREKELTDLCGKEITFENDYKELFLGGKMGVNEFCKRWGANKSWIIYGIGDRKSWVEQLGLPKHTRSTKISAPQYKKSNVCKTCGVSNTILDFCHWIARKDGGPRIPENGFDGCPNCNRRLDSIVIPNIERGIATEDDKSFYAKCKEIIHAYIDDKYKNDDEIKNIWKRRVDSRSMK